MTATPMHIRLRILAIITLFLGSLSGQAQDSAWKCVKNSDSVLVYARKSDSANYRIVKATTQLKTSLSSLVSLLADAANHKNWVYLNKKAVILKKENPFSWIIYSQTDAPWPVTDRDIVSKTWMKQNPATKEVTIHAEADPDYLPEKPDHVRIPFARAEWHFIPQGNGWVKAVFTIEVDVGGNVPQWLVNLTAARGPFQTMRNLRKMVKKNKYKTSRLPYIKEPQN